MKIIPDNPADVKMIKKEIYLNIMDILLAFSVKFPVTVCMVILLVCETHFFFICDTEPTL